VTIDRKNELRPRVRASGSKVPVLPIFAYEVDPRTPPASSYALTVKVRLFVKRHETETHLQRENHESQDARRRHDVHHSLCHGSLLVRSAVTPARWSTNPSPNSFCQKSEYTRTSSCR